MKVIKRGGKYIVRSKTGKVLGRHKSKAAAERQRRKIEMEKHKHE